MIEGINLYHKYQSSLRTGDVIEFRNNSILGGLIRRKTGYNVNHTSIVGVWTLDGGTSKRRYIIESTGAGCHLTLLSDKLRRLDGEAYLLRSKDCSVMGPVVEAALRLRGTPYDFRSLLKLWNRPVMIDRSELYCSELIQVAMIDAGKIDAGWNDGIAVVPGEIEKMGYHETSFRIF